MLRCHMLTKDKEVSAMFLIFYGPSNALERKDNSGKRHCSNLPWRSLISVLFLYFLIVIFFVTIAVWYPGRVLKNDDK